MTTYTFSQLLNNQTIAFNKLTDVLRFDTYMSGATEVTIRPAELLINSTASGVQFSVGGKSIVLTGITLDDLGISSTTNLSNIRFESTGLLLVGEGTTGAGGASPNNISGGAGDDALLGLAGNDTISGGTGADLMIGGLGDDFYKVDNIGDIITEENNTIPGAGLDSVLSSVTFTLNNYIENLTLAGNAAINATGNTLDNLLTGNSANNVLNGLAGKDTMIGGDGNDSYFVDNILDRVIETNGIRTQIDTVNSTLTYTLGNNLEKLVLIGTGATLGVGNHRANQITGNGAVNTLNGMTGADIMTGGDGNDVYIVDDAGDVVTETNTSIIQIDMVAATVDYVLGTSVENLRLLGTADLDGTGNGLANILFSNAGSNTLNGMNGIDTVSYANVDLSTLVAGTPGTRLTTISTTAGVEVNLSITGAQDTKGSGLDTLIGIENLTGSSYNDQLTGNTGNNTLDGGLGSDLLIGGKGNDTYVVDGADVVVEVNGSVDGIDTIMSSVSYWLSANVEYLVLTGSALNGTGNTLANRLTGNAANNVLDGGAGADKMEGGSGNDTFVVDNQGDEVSDFAGIDLVQTYINYAMSSSIENLRLMGQNALNGTGNAANNTIWTNTGNNVVAGGTNTVVGDTISYQYGASSGVTVDLSKVSTQNTGGSGADTLSGFENLVGSDYSDLLLGSITANLLDGRGGIDTVSYSNANGPVTVNLTLGTAKVGAVIDTVLNFENAIGTDFDDILIGNLGSNIFVGGNGQDTVSYEDIKVNEGGVVADLSKTTAQDTGSSGFDTFRSVENLVGSQNNDVLTGNTLDNVLSGGLGVDRLTGGTGSDTFVFEVDIGGGNIDTITDYNVASDTIELSSAVFSGLSTGQLASTAFVKAAAAQDGNDRIIYHNGALFFDADGTGSAEAIQFATISNLANLSAADFLVV